MIQSTARKVVSNCIDIDLHSQLAYYVGIFDLIDVYLYIAI